MKYLIIILSSLFLFGCNPQSPAKLVSKESIGLIKSANVQRVANYVTVTEITTEKLFVTIYGTADAIPIGVEATLSTYDNGDKSIDWKGGGYWVHRKQ